MNYFSCGFYLAFINLAHLSKNQNCHSLGSFSSSSCKGLWTMAGLFELNLLSFREEVEEEQFLTTRIKLKISHYVCSQ
jgi:hypothetical protein